MLLSIPVFSSAVSPCFPSPSLPMGMSLSTRLPSSLRSSVSLPSPPPLPYCRMCALVSPVTHCLLSFLSPLHLSLSLSSLFVSSCPPTPLTFSSSRFQCPSVRFLSPPLLLSSHPLHPTCLLVLVRLLLLSIPLPSSLACVILSSLSCAPHVLFSCPSSHQLALS